MAEHLKNGSEQEKKFLQRMAEPFFGVLPSGKMQNH